VRRLPSFMKRKLAVSVVFSFSLPFASLLLIVCADDVYFGYKLDEVYAEDFYPQLAHWLAKQTGFQLPRGTKQKEAKIQFTKNVCI